MRWLEVSIKLRGELVEPITDLLARYAHKGVVLEPDPLPTEHPQTPASDRIWIRAYLRCDHQLAHKKRKIEEGLWHLSQIQPIGTPTYRTLEEKDWAEAWKAHYHPIEVGRRFVIQPAWIPAKTSDRLPLIIDPGMAFGTGTHPTTRLCLEALEDYLIPGQTIVDLGCGSGILSMAAAHLGAERVLAFDIDQAAVRTCRSNISRNALDDRVHVREGSLAELVAEQKQVGLQPHLLLANILASTLDRLIHEGLANCVRPGGIFILSGILDWQVDDILALGAGHGMEPQETKAEDDWRALVLCRAQEARPEQPASSLGAGQRTRPGMPALSSDGSTGIKSGSNLVS